MSRRTLYMQILILAACAVVIAELVVNFPAPSPLIKPLLSPKQRWTTEQVRHWVETGNFDSSYLEFFARDPDRLTPAGDNLVSPSDGVVQDIEYRNGKTYLVIGLSFWDVHVVRTASSGVVEGVEQEGSYVTPGHAEKRAGRGIFPSRQGRARAGKLCAFPQAVATWQFGLLQAIGRAG